MAFNLKKYESKKPDTSKEKFMAFMTTSVSTAPQVYSDDDDNELEKEPNWKTKYETLFKHTVKMVKMNEKVDKKWKESKITIPPLKLN